MDAYLASLEDEARELIPEQVGEGGNEAADPPLSESEPQAERNARALRRSPTRRRGRIADDAESRLAMRLAGDVGGTTTRLAIVSPEQGPGDPIAERVFESGAYASLETMLREFLEDVGGTIERAVIGVAGPVVGGRAELTNLPWTLDEVSLRDALRVEEVELINDLVATARALPALQPHDFHTLQRGDPVPHGTMAVIAPGTGLGQALLVWDGSSYRALASEGGHTDFGPRDALELDLLRFLSERLDHVSYERVCSGSGIPNLYRFLKENGAGTEPEWLTERLATAADETPVIVAAALEERDPVELCARTLELFTSILGAQAGNLALTVLATGGVYLAGGIPPRVLPFLERPRFLKAFRSKGRLSEVLDHVPVHVVVKSDTALLGATLRALEA